jgi:hypothetical protein
VKTRDVDPLNFGKRFQKILLLSSLLFPCDHLIADFQDDFLAIPDDDGIEEISHGFRIEDRRTPCNNERESLIPVLGEKRNTTQVEHIEDVGETKFILEGKTQYIKLMKRSRGFEGRKRTVLLSHDPLHINPRGEGSFAAHPFFSIEDMIKDLNPEMGHPYFINIGKG